ncbi:BadM/Rrf2 family transcriptional regulator [Maritalea mobilis]|uniref:BadM/Rrf2 family transcriptional regulator n=1 Tax=Maritalea mobilis TaxID=483324 RepID=A0A4R6VVT8_9HYPH|nr:BadM/Rrf2 family transcriptional regulator [Maritalea mobilis]
MYIKCIFTTSSQKRNLEFGQIDKVRQFVHLTSQTDYSLRLLMLLGMVAPKKMTISQVANILQLKKNHLTKIVHHLSKHEILNTSRGKTGGISLSEVAHDKTIAELIRISEPNFSLVECLDRQQCSCEFSGYCELTGLFTSARSAFFDVLSDKTLGDILNNKKKTSPLLSKRIISENL